MKKLVSLLLTTLLLTFVPAMGESTVIPAVGDEIAVDPSFEGEAKTTDSFIVVDDGEEDALGNLEMELSEEILELDMNGEILAGEDVPNVALLIAPSFEGQFAGFEGFAGMPGNEALLAGYVDQLFGVGDIRRNGNTGENLTGVSLNVYRFLAKQIKKVAAGKLESTEFRIPNEIVSYTSPYTELNELYANYTSLIYALYYDYPYELFWWEYTSSVNTRYDGETVCIGFPVTEDFAADEYSIQVEKVQRLQVAAKNAKAVVKKNAGLSDYDKICAYRDYILKAVSYYDDSSDSNNDGQQLIWVFDGDHSTNVVCEGYARAFQYLCEMSTFKKDIRCYRVNGYVNDKEESMPKEIDMDRRHGWNVVTMDDGKNYLVDLTNSDDGMIGGVPGNEGSLFLAGYDAVNGDTYGIVAVEWDNYKHWVAYTIDETFRSLIPTSAQKLASKDYKVQVKKPKSVSITEGKTATVAVGSELPLTAVVKPAGATTKLTWSSSNTKVAVVSQKGVVTPKKVGTTKITVKTDNGKSATITVKVIAKSIVKPTKVTITKGKKATIKVGEKLTLKTKLTPAKAKTTFKWVSSNKKVATVSSKGVVTAKAPG